MEPGTVLGGYRIEELIGTGGMSAVYRATHVKLGRRAAIKVLSDSLAADPAFVSRFFHEARVVNEIGHPNIIDIVDFIDSDDTPPRRVAYVMELVEGPPLSKALAGGRLSVRQSLNVALQLLEALEAVHRIHVVHRDLKPDNVLVIGNLATDLSTRPSVKILDFGIAKIEDPSGSHRTSTGMRLGTPAYMAPEQVAGDAVSFATDVYAVGEILYEMLTGARLFSGPNIQVLRSKVSEQPPQIELPAGMAADDRLAQLITSCIVQEQTARPSVDECAAEVRAILATLPADAEVTVRAPIPVLTPAPVPSAKPLPRGASPALLQGTLAGSADTMIRGGRSGMSALAWVGVIVGILGVLGFAGALAYVYLRDPVVMVDVKQIEEQPLPIEPQPQPEPAQVKDEPKVETPAEATPSPAPAEKKKKSKKQHDEDGPFKKGEFPSW